MTLNTAVVAPMPSIKETIAVIARPGRLRISRKERRRSCSTTVQYGRGAERLLSFPKKLSVGGEGGGPGALREMPLACGPVLRAMINAHDLNRLPPQAVDRNIGQGRKNKFSRTFFLSWASTMRLGFQ